jgi:hypothetical protein
MSVAVFSFSLYSRPSGEVKLIVRSIASIRLRCPPTMLSQVGVEDLRAGVQRVDQHLAVGRAGDLDPPVGQIGRRRRDRPVTLADLPGLLGEGREGALVQLGLALGPGGEQVLPAGVEQPVQPGQELERLRGQDPVVPVRDRPGHLDATLSRHADCLPPLVGCSCQHTHRHRARNALGWRA